MKVSYLIEVNDPHLHVVKTHITLERAENQTQIEFFLPSWSPGSYLMREYSRHIRWLKATQENGEELWWEQTAKGTWMVDFKRSQLKKNLKTFTLTYEIYLHELTVRTSHVDASHAFLHGPSYLMGLSGVKVEPTIEFRFPPLWSKISTSLEEVPGPREKFIFTAKNYDELLDCPVEIGCQETDGFKIDGVPHALAFWGETYPHGQNLKGDWEKVVTHVVRTMGEMPFDHYQFITHFSPKLYGGLEHLNSTALHFDGRRLSVRKDYLGFLGLIAHEYFHAWNVKRIRPKELGPFDYRNEAYTSMLWLAEGLTSAMDDWFVYRAGLCTLEEYLEAVKGHLEAYYGTPGRKFHSLEMSSFNAWIKLYRPDENSKNSSISYYLKGGLVFTVLHALLLEKDKHLDDLLKLLWSSYKERPEQGLVKEEVYTMVEKLGGTDIRDRFIAMVETTQDIELEKAFHSMGVEFKWQENPGAWLGAEWDFQGERAIVRTVLLDSPAARSGLNAGDEMLSLNGLRVLKDDVEKFSQNLKIDQHYEVVVSRLGKLTSLSLIPGKAPRSLKELSITDRTRAEKAFRKA